MPVPFRSYDWGSHLLHLVVNLSPESSVVRSEAIGLSCSNKNRQFTVIWLWFNNAFKRGSKWLIKSGDLFTPVCFIRPSLWAGALHTPALPEKEQGWVSSKCREPDFHSPGGDLQRSSSLPLSFCPSLSFFPFSHSLALFFPFLFSEQWKLNVNANLSLSLKTPVREAACHPYLWALNGFYQSEVALNHARAVINTNEST